MANTLSQATKRALLLYSGKDGTFSRHQGEKEEEITLYAITVFCQNFAPSVK